MPLDAHLHEYLHDSVDRHVLKTKHLDADDHRKFSKRTPRLLADAYKRIWDTSLGPESGSPSSAEIITDTTNVIDRVYLDVFKMRGR